MTAIPATDALRNAANQGVGQQLLEDLVQAMKELPGGAARSTLTIAGGAVAPTRASHAIDTEAAAAIDDLDTIALTHHPDGRLLLVRSTSAARIVVLRHNQGADGKLLLRGGFYLPLTHPLSWVLFERVGTAWVEIAREIYDQPAWSGFANLLDNANGAVSQVGSSVPALADNAQGIDRWRVLSDGGTVNLFSVTTSLPAGADARCAVQSPSANVKFGVFQIVPAKRVASLRGGYLTFSGKLSVNNARMGNLKVGVAEWTGTADATSADPISAWGADGVTPTLAANWAFLNAPANLNVTAGSFPNNVTEFVLSVKVGATANNLAVFIWNDDTSIDAGDNFEFTNLMLNRGAILLPYEHRPLVSEIEVCLDFLRSSIPYGTAKTTVAGVNGCETGMQVVGASTSQVQPAVRHRPMNSAGSITILNPHANNNQIRNSTANTDWSGSNVAVSTPESFIVSGSTPAGSASGQIFRFHWLRDSRL